MTTANLLDFDLEGLAAFCERLGEKRFRATQLFRWIHQRGASDFAHMTDAIRSMLAPLGLDVVEADSKPAALHAVESQTFAVILMDVRNKSLDGYKTATVIRERESFEHVVALDRLS